MVYICKSQALGRHGIQPSMAAHAVSSDRLRPLHCSSISGPASSIPYRRHTAMHEQNTASNCSLQPAPC